jgi:hypothetical protein
LSYSYLSLSFTDRQGPLPGWSHPSASPFPLFSPSYQTPLSASLPCSRRAHRPPSTAAPGPMLPHYPEPRPTPPCFKAAPSIGHSSSPLPISPPLCMSRLYSDAVAASNCWQGPPTPHHHGVVAPSQWNKAREPLPLIGTRPGSRSLHASFTEKVRRRHPRWLSSCRLSSVSSHPVVLSQPPRPTPLCQSMRPSSSPPLPSPFLCACHHHVELPGRATACPSVCRRRPAAKFNH